MVDKLNPIQNIAAKEGQKIAKKVWDTIPESDQDSLKDLIRGIPVDKNPLNMLIDLAIIQYKMAFGKAKRVAIIGPANVGKSTLFNQLVRHKSDKAEVGPVPGTTRINQLADAGLFTVIDTPGADAVGYVGEKERNEAFDAAHHADFLIIMFDAIQGIKQTELDLFKDLKSLNKPYILVLNKIDLTRRHEKEVLDKASLNLGVNLEQIIPISATKGDGISKILLGIAQSDPALLVSLAQALPQYRWKLAWRAIVTSASLSAAIALTPLPVIDFIPLVVTQSTLVLTIARIYNFTISAKRAKELIATFGLGLLGRTLFQQFSKAGGIPGWLLSSAIATSMTVAMGYASILWFEKGERLSHKALQEISKKMTQNLLTAFKNIFRKKPNKESMEQVVASVLNESSFSERESLEKAVQES